MSASAVPLWAWLLFGGLLVVLLVIDLLTHRGHRATSRKAAIIWSGIWIGVGLGFALFVWHLRGRGAAEEYLAAYLIEKSLSLDNLFVFLVIFSALRIPHESHRAVLSWGIFGALLFRALFILLGAAALDRYQFVVYVFGAILFWAGYRVLRADSTEPGNNRLLDWLSRRLPVTNQLHDQRFFARERGRLVMTPLFLALMAIELTDITFAVDSVPAALAISKDRFVVYSSNAFAVLGLRSLYLVLEDLLGKLSHLRYGLAAVLFFAGFKLLASDWIHIPPLLSVGIILVCIGVAVWSSLRAARRARG